MKNADLEAKSLRLQSILASMEGGVAVAFSGGIDSTVVAKAAQLVLGDRAVAVTSDSPSVARSELADARRLAEIIGIRHIVMPTAEFENPLYTRNEGDRCYHCKSELYDRLIDILPTLNATTICSGANLDDLGDYRPGLTAAAERHVRHPLQEAGFTKADVRSQALDWGLPTWDKPASPCLSSRLAPGMAVTIERTARIEAAEAMLKRLGLRDCRVRLHEGELARIEVQLSDLESLATTSVREKLTSEMRRLGFRYVTLDLEGLRSGSMNDLVRLEVRSRFQAEPGARSNLDTQNLDRHSP